MKMLPLPHRYPFVLIDSIDTIEPGRFAAARRLIAADDPLLREDGVLPTTMLVEMLAQCCGIAAAGTQGGAGQLVGVARFGTRGCVRAGDRVDIKATVVRRFGALVKVRGRVRADGRLRAGGEILLQLAPPTSR